jgi:hypothetical protein
MSFDTNLRYFLQRGFSQPTPGGPAKGYKFNSPPAYALQMLVVIGKR